VLLDVQLQLLHAPGRQDIRALHATFCLHSHVAAQYVVTPFQLHVPAAQLRSRCHRSCIMQVARSAPSTLEGSGELGLSALCGLLPLSNTLCVESARFRPAC
jgi:hypothetical protein